jgi:hypothetical protein
MKNLLLMLLGILFIITACNVVSNPAGEVSNLVKNGSFEENGKGSLKYWFGPDSSLAKLVNDAPERGGQWSVAIPMHRLEPENFRLAQAVNLHSGTHILQFSFWAKKKGIAGGARLLRQTSDGKLIGEGGLVVKDTVWTQYTLLDTVQLQKGEKLYVDLSGGATELGSGTTSFDLVSLTEVGSSK